MKFKIDMSECDVLMKDSVIALSDSKGLIKGFQINQEIIDNLLTNWKVGKNKLLRKKLGIKVNSIIFKNLKGSDVDNYAYLMFKDNYNLLPTYVNLSLEDIEKFLI